MGVVVSKNAVKPVTAAMPTNYEISGAELSSLALRYGFSHKFDKGKNGFRFLHEMSLIKKNFTTDGKTNIMLSLSL